MTAVAVAASLVLSGIALADQVNVDNDLVSPGNQNTVSITTTAGAAVNTSMQIVVSYQGSKHLTANQNLTFTNDSGTTNLPTGYTAPDITVAIGGTWTTGSFAAMAGTLSFTAPAPGSYSYTVQYDEPASVSCASSPCLGGSASETITLTVNPATPTCDTTPPDAPTVTAVASPDAVTDWYNATSNTAGFTVAPDINAEYSLDNGTTWTAYSSEVDFSTDGQYSVIARNFLPATASCDRVDGTDSSPIAFNVDRTEPMITDEGFDSGTAGNSGWYTSPVTEGFAASDATSGLADCAATFTQTSGSAEEGSAVTIASGPCSDNAGNTNPGIDSAAYKIDLTDPGVTCETAPQFLLHQSGATVSATVTDSVSGPASSPVSAAADTSSVGTHSVDLTGYDVAGRSTTVSCSYTVVYDWTGFFQPVDNLTDATPWNSAKAGQAIPVKFNLGGYQGTNILNSGYPKITSRQCPSTSVLVDPLEQYTTTTAGGSALTYDTTAQQYIYAWKTDKAWAGKCFTFELGLNDGTSHTFWVQFTR